MGGNLTGYREESVRTPRIGASPEPASEYSNVRKAISGLAGTGALVLALSQALPLFHTFTSARGLPVGSETVGAAHAYGVLVLAVLGLLLAAGVLISGSRAALLLIGVVAVAALAVCLGHDLPAARSHGFGLLAGHYQTAINVVGVGLYVELAGALALLGASGLGFLLGGDALAPAGPRSPGPLRRSTRGARAGSSRRAGPRSGSV